MNTTPVTAFIEKAEDKLRTLRNGILVSREEGWLAGLHQQTGDIRRLQEEAAGLTFSHVAEVLGALEQETAQVFMPGNGLTEAAARNLLDLISYAEAEVLKLKFSDDDSVLDLGNLLDVSFNALQADPEPQIDPVAVEIVEEDEFEPDAEMLEIFSEEADELISNIEANLELLSASPANRDALWEIRRHAHTFKGAAGIIGFKKPSEMAHKVEDLLDHLAQNEIAPKPEVIEFITAATNCLRAFTKGETVHDATARSGEVYKLFDRVMLSLSEPAETTTETMRPEPGTQVAEPEPVKTPAEPVAEAATPAENEPPVRRPIVRVSIERLDELVRIARDLVVSRASVEQQIADFEKQVDALTQTTRRLQAANARIENDFEASMLSSQGPVSFQRQHSTYRSDLPETLENEEFDSLEFDRYTDFHQSSRELAEAIQDCFALGTTLEALKGTLESVIDDQRRLIEETQEKVMQIRLIKFESLATRLQRAVRVTCEEENKKAEIVLLNQDVEIDTDVLDSLVEPLIHLIRNAVVHGIEPPHTRRMMGKPETGRITVRVSNEETHIELKVTDDGRGIATAALKEKAVKSGLIGEAAVESLDTDGLLSLMFLPGLTTAERLTMNAGRGVGMSIVKESIESKNGSISVETSVQHGTTFTVKMPLAFAVTQAMLVRSDRHLAAVPLKVVKRISEFSPSDFRHNGSETVIVAGSAEFPVRYLADHFSHKRQTETDSLIALMIESGEERFALIADEVLRTEDIAIKPLGKPLDTINGLLGAAMLGNGQVVPVLDVSHFKKMQPHMQFETTVPEIMETPPFVLVVDDSPSVRHMTSKTLTTAGWTVVTAKDGVEALEIISKPEKPGVILTDVEMPRMDGYELVLAVKNDDASKHIPVVFITSRVSEKHRERAAELGISEYLTKPFVESELLGTVERLTIGQAELAI